jgi:hypothetical protein
MFVLSQSRLILTPSHGPLGQIALAPHLLIGPPRLQLTAKPLQNTPKPLMLTPKPLNLGPP